MNDFLKFLGTGGARFVVSRQLRASGGIWIHFQGTHVHVDPGPGALVKATGSRPALNPADLQAILVSHRHLDHANDLNIMVEAMTQGGTKKRGTVFLPQDALQGEPILFSYLRENLERVVFLEEKGHYQVGSISFTTPLRHEHSTETYGFRFSFLQSTVSLIVDTLFTEKLFEAYQKSDCLIIHTVRLKPAEHRELLHLCVEDARLLIENIRPRLAILTHFGMTMLQAKPWEIAEDLTQKTGIQVIAARDGMTVDLASL